MLRSVTQSGEIRSGEFVRFSKPPVELHVTSTVPSELDCACKAAVSAATFGVTDAFAVVVTRCSV